ncbi:hypothetical protein V5R04_11530 [Jonesiaceae bacterium BS-20]|uniref:Uncharacterized protein n=1 Tax=Jonesiaceae bacterium BS-20 TaxID=3120821 RepID=A0AAU7DU65_9MICO
MSLSMSFLQSMALNLTGTSASEVSMSVAKLDALILNNLNFGGPGTGGTQQVSSPLELPVMAQETGILGTDPFQMIVTVVGLLAAIATIIATRKDLFSSSTMGKMNGEVIETVAMIKDAQDAGLVDTAHYRQLRSRLELLTQFKMLGLRESRYWTGMISGLVLLGLGAVLLGTPMLLDSSDRPRQLMLSILCTVCWGLGSYWLTASGPVLLRDSKGRFTLPDSVLHSVHMLNVPTPVTLLDQMARFARWSTPQAKRRKAAREQEPVQSGEAIVTRFHRAAVVDAATISVLVGLALILINVTE